MTIAVLGWGSLIHNTRELLIENTFGGNGWKFEGPMLPIEFSRISKGNRLTLVIDETGTPIQTLYAISQLNNLDQALENLRQREGMTSTKYIGFLDITNDTHSIFTNRTDLENIRAWANKNNFDAVIWTGLKPNFEEKILKDYGEKKEHNIANIKWFFENLQNDEYINARDYIQSAPVSTNTHLRKEIQKLFNNILLEQVLHHESGHILIAKAFDWDVDDIKKNHRGSPLVVKFCKDVKGDKYCGVIKNKTDPDVILANWQRTIITQGGWAAESLRNYRIKDQFDEDNRNAHEILNELSSELYDLQKARDLARTIIELNTEALQIIKYELKCLYNGDTSYNFRKRYIIKEIPSIQ